MTKAELRERILTGLNEDPDSPIFWTTAELNTIVQEGQECLAERTSAIRRSVFLGLQSGQCVYSIHALADDVLQIGRVWLGTSDRRLTRVTLSDLDARHTTWRSVSGDPDCWFPVSWDQFGIWPIPSTGGGVIRVDYAAWPPALLDDDDEPEFDTAEHDALVLYGIYDGLMKQWDYTRGIQIYQLAMGAKTQTQARSGIRRISTARTFQTPEVTETPFPHDVGR